ncbi:MAG TPA: TAXI family TRAP transporter solute-binding subunit [Pseudogracilibacillus sp.]|nr:TAXI family TRAP transporter solute-binding subunit [Pseudogracilibacillus sp.]
MSKTRFFTIVTMLASLILILAACGGNDAGGSGDNDGGGDSSGSGKNARIAIGPPGSETNSISKVLLAAHGLEDGDYQAYQEGFGDAADLVQDGNIDITIGVLGLPAGSIESLQASTGDVVMLNLDDEAIEEIEANSPYERYTIEKDNYEFLEEDVETIAAFAVMVANTDTIDEELGYELARIMVENAEEVTHAQAAELTLENALNGAEGLPIHPGAKRYYEEQGLTVDNPVAEVTADESNRKAEFILGTGSQGGTYYPLGGEIANVWNQYLDSNFTNTETGASTENLGSIGSGNLDLGMSVHVPALDAIVGEGDFDGNPIENVAFIGHIYPEVVQIVTRESTGITSLSELK